jgi:hypothetical protein
MCLICIELSKENIKPRDFWHNFREVEADHVQDVVVAVLNTSEAYQAELASEATREYDDEGEQ